MKIFNWLNLSSNPLVVENVHNCLFPRLWIKLKYKSKQHINVMNNLWSFVCLSWYHSTERLFESYFSFLYRAFLSADVCRYQSPMRNQTPNVWLFLCCQDSSIIVTSCFWKYNFLGIFVQYFIPYVFVIFVKIFNLVIWLLHYWTKSWTYLQSSEIFFVPYPI